MSSDDLRTVVAIAAVAVSLFAIVTSVVVARTSMRLSQRLWEDSNRPIVTAYVAEHKMGNTASTFDLVVCNSGSRPATHVSLHAPDGEIDRLIKPGAERIKIDIIHRCFHADAEVPLLKDGEQLVCAFGAYAGEEGKPWLNYGEQIEIEVRYLDLDGRRYRSRQPLKIYAREGFGGGVWSP